MSPPEHALVLCCDEKSQIQGPKSHSARTAVLVAALNTGWIDYLPLRAASRHTEWLDFLRQIDRETSKDQSLHLICANYATRKHPKVKEWLEKHPPCAVHFTPTSASWLNMVERFFATSPPRLGRCVFRSVPNSMPPSRNTSPCITKPQAFCLDRQGQCHPAKSHSSNRHLSSKQNDLLH